MIILGYVYGNEFVRTVKKTWMIRLKIVWLFLKP
jgi:hypothetical protein